MEQGQWVRSQPDEALIMSRPSRFAVVGHPIGHSRSPEIHHAFASQFGIDISYQRLDAPPERFEASVADFFSGGGAGLNITVPHKAAAYLLCQSVSARAALAGVINTLSREHGDLRGDNTDGVGLLEDLRRASTEVGESLAGARVLLIGAGGAARGALAGLLDEELEGLVVTARDPAQADRLAAQFSRHPQVTSIGLGDTIRRSFDIVINATAAGLIDESPELNPGWLSDCRLAYDLSYSAAAFADTPFLRLSKSFGAAAICDGLGMLVEQAAEAFHVWHGLRPDTGAVLHAMRNPS